jgi:hypothetical protein
MLGEDVILIKIKDISMKQWGITIEIGLEQAPFVVFV